MHRHLFGNFLNNFAQRLIATMCWPKQLYCRVDLLDQTTIQVRLAATVGSNRNIGVSGGNDPGSNSVQSFKKCKGRTRTILQIVNNYSCWRVEFASYALINFAIIPS